MSELDDFRSEVRAWLTESAPENLRGVPLLAGMGGGPALAAEIIESRKKWRTLMAERGWTAPTWPKEYGGGGLAAPQAKVLQQEIGRLQLAPPLMGMGLSMIGPTLLVHGSEEQKLRHLPKIVSGEVTWCQGFSEPNAGSDLASLQMAAVKSGDNYTLNGQKVWTSGAQLANWIFLIARTDPSNKHMGITFMLAPMDTPGIEIKPIRLISGNSPFCETFFSDVVVPVENVVGGEGRGWTVAKTLLGFERSGMGGTAGGGPRRAGGADAGGLAAAAKDSIGVDSEGRLADGGIRDRLAQLHLDQMALGLTIKRAADGRKAGGPPGAETSMFKIYASELGHRRDELTMSILGSSTLHWGEGMDEGDVARARGWLAAKATTIYGGTSEIQRNIIARRVLQLPTNK